MVHVHFVEGLTTGAVASILQCKAIRDFPRPSVEWDFHDKKFSEIKHGFWR